MTNPTPEQVIRMALDAGCDAGHDPGCSWLSFNPQGQITVVTGTQRLPCDCRLAQVVPGYSALDVLTKERNRLANAAGYIVHQCEHEETRRTMTLTFVEDELRAALNPTEEQGS
jgi:hypothetical protein